MNLKEDDHINYTTEQNRTWGRIFRETEQSRVCVFLSVQREERRERRREKFNCFYLIGSRFSTKKIIKRIRARPNQLTNHQTLVPSPCRKCL